ncbi:MAG: hypothetical protein K0R55_3943 [Sporomusa sp.]|nr:hypothetical protein [Sporomusa sp.]
MNLDIESYALEEVRRITRAYFSGIISANQSVVPPCNHNERTLISKIWILRTEGESYDNKYKEPFCLRLQKKWL